MKLSERLKNAFCGQEMEKCSVTNGNVTEVLYSTKNGRKTLFCNETKSMYIYDGDKVETIIPFNMIRDCMEVICVLDAPRDEKLIEQFTQATEIRFSEIATGQKWAIFKQPEDEEDEMTFMKMSMYRKIMDENAQLKERNNELANVSKHLYTTLRLLVGEGPKEESERVSELDYLIDVDGIKKLGE